MYDELARRAARLNDKITELRRSLDVDRRLEEIAALEHQIAAPDFWNDQATAQRVTRRVAELRAPIEEVDGFRRRLDDLNVMIELAEEAADLEMAAEAQREAADLEEKVRQFELKVLLNGKYDAYNAILTIHAGAGGTEAQDWAEMLERMYLRWAEHHGYKVEELDRLAGDEAGIKSVTLAVRGPYAYGFLRPEMGVHRLVRISPFDASGRRHTSFAAVEVMPEIEDDVEDIQIRPEDLRIDTFRSSGAGGQHVNKTESAVRITHLPTGIVVSCQQERSQMQNRAVAMMMLRSKLVELKIEEQNKEMAQVRGPQMEIAWGSQIRSYVFQPYTLVKDHRSGVEVGNAQAVMDGELDPFIYGYLEKRASGELSRP
ncbi:peptide chain release factor 2 [Symbiobacterium terraclitae]|uniref:peptide chain release factor 2 n=1 Tax=Symbiobacterium terraclitae TaxID=557451 RepID=UPI001AE13D02|nr:peptide chain release factor 2 [Symbiobacterium terraclitae]